MRYFSLLDLLAEAPPRLRIVDVGAMDVPGHPAEPFQVLVDRGAAVVIGFEPVQEEFAKLEASKRENQIWLPYAVGDGETRDFHICNFSMTSSLYQPNHELMSKFNNLDELCQVVRTERVQTHRMDDIPEVADCDYMKLDVQGAELDVIQGAREVLRGVVALQCEVEFVPLYIGQPLFAEIDIALRAAGFLFHRLLGVATRTAKPFIADNNPVAPGSQMLWGNVVYVKDWTRLAELPAEKLLSMAIILNDVYRSWDMAALVLRAYEAKTGSSIADVFQNKVITSDS